MGFANSKLADAALLAWVVDLEVVRGYKTLEYRKANPAWHRSGSYHAQKGWVGYRRAADMNKDGHGDYSEQSDMRKYAVPWARAYGLSVTCGVSGYVKGHSPGDGMHCHGDVGRWSNLGGGEFISPWWGQCATYWPSRAFQYRQGLAVDGIPGPLTNKALQKRVGLSGKDVDGILGPKSWRAIQKFVGAGQDGIPGGETYIRMGLAIQNNKL